MFRSHFGSTIFCGFFVAASLHSFWRHGAQKEPQDGGCEKGGGEKGGKQACGENRFHGLHGRGGVEIEVH